MKRVVGSIVVVAVLLGGAFLLGEKTRPSTITPTHIDLPSLVASPTATPSPTPHPIPPSVILQSDYQIFQSFNNCGPAALSMALRYYGINKSQEELGQALRPWQNAAGDNDDKSVSLAEMGEKAREFGFTVYDRPNGSVDIMKRFIAAGMPVVTSTWLHPGEDIGHYRVVNGYDDTTGELIQQDSMEGRDIRYSYDVFNELWKNNNFEYMVMVPSDKEEIAAQIMGEDEDEQKAWRRALATAQTQLAADPNDVYAGFNASIAYFHLNDYAASVKEFERVEPKLTMRTLWYQIEPIRAYYELGNYDRVLAITDGILNNQNRAFSELYIIRGNIYKKQGNTEASRAEYEKAVMYNVNLKEAQAALAAL